MGLIYITFLGLAYSALIDCVCCICDQPLVQKNNDKYYHNYTSTTLTIFNFLY